MDGQMQGWMKNTGPPVPRPRSLRIPSLCGALECVRRSSPVALRRPAGDFPLTADADSPASKKREKTDKGQEEKHLNGSSARRSAHSLPRRWTDETARTRDRALRTIKDK